MKKQLVGAVLAFAVASLSLMSCAQVRGNGPTLQPLKTFTLDCGNGVSLKLVLIPAGEFMMGGDEPPDQVAQKCNGKAEWFQNEQPQHRVKITKPFYMGAYVVTEAQYEAVTGLTQLTYPDARKETQAVVHVSWYNADEFCRKLSQKTGMTIRLPTEAEWEYACRAGTTTPFNTGETISTDQANYNGHRTYGSGRKGVYRGHFPVGSFAPNDFGLYDMHGNVMQWCQDWYDAAYYKNSPTNDPTGPEKGDERVMRGSSWLGGPEGCRSARRGSHYPSYDPCSLGGFRVVCEPKP